jgi:dephospho-CoA kinase
MGNPLMIGLTGGIACGKTTVAHLFIQQGAAVIDADEIAHQLVVPGQPALAQIVDYFGIDILEPTGHLNRAKLRQQVFAHPEQRQQLEAILHPLVLQQMWQQAQQQNTPYCLLCIPLLIETGLVNRVERVLVIDCPTDLQRQRLKQRSGLADVEITQILAAQVHREKRLAIADDVIHNNGTVTALEQQVVILHQKYLQLANYRGNSL